MNARNVGVLVGRDLRRGFESLSAAAFGIILGTAALFFFLSLGLGIRSVLLGDVFPINRLELEPAARADPGLIGLVLGTSRPPSISAGAVRQIQRQTDVAQIFPKLRFAFPCSCSARRGAEILGHEIQAAQTQPAHCIPVP